jgi:hypothetical protein
MLRAPESLPHRRLRPESQRRQYEEFVEQKIEEYKDHLSRPELLGIADDAVRELEMSTADQLVLTEVLMLDHVDRLIRKRLRLPTFRRWRERHRRLRQAQQEPTHWGIDVDSPLRELALCMEDGDSALVVGTGIAPCGYLLAAYESHVVLIDQDLAMVESTERRAASEGLAGRFEALVVSLDGWFPDVAPTLAVIDATVLARLDSSGRHALLSALQRQTTEGGVHTVVPPAPHAEAPPLEDGALETLYDDWEIGRAEHARGTGWFVARKPST